MLKNGYYIWKDAFLVLEGITLIPFGQEDVEVIFLYTNNGIDLDMAQVT